MRCAFCSTTAPGNSPTANWSKALCGYLRLMPLPLGAPCMSDQFRQCPETEHERTQTRTLLSQACQSQCLPRSHKVWGIGCQLLPQSELRRKECPIFQRFLESAGEAIWGIRSRYCPVYCTLVLGLQPTLDGQVWQGQ